MVHPWLPRAVGIQRGVVPWERGRRDVVRRTTVGEVRIANRHQIPNLPRAAPHELTAKPFFSTLSLFSPRVRLHLPVRYRKDFGELLKLHRQGSPGYNEIVLDGYLYADRLPHSLEAFFYLAGPKCDDLCVSHACAAYKLYAETYPSYAHEHVPLLVLDLRADAAERPFSEAPPAACP